MACVRKGGIILRKGKSARKGKNPVASTSAQPEVQELPDEDQEDEADGEALPDESFDPDWSRNFMCVADPFIVTKVRVSPFIAVMTANAQCSRIPELRWSDQEANLYAVRE